MVAGVHIFFTFAFGLSKDPSHLVLVDDIAIIFFNGCWRVLFFATRLYSLFELKAVPNRSKNIRNRFLTNFYIETVIQKKNPTFFFIDKNYFRKIKK